MLAPFASWVASAGTNRLELSSQATTGAERNSARRPAYEEQLLQLFEGNVRIRRPDAVERKIVALDGPKSDPRATQDDGILKWTLGFQADGGPASGEWTGSYAKYVEKAVNLYPVGRDDRRHTFAYRNTSPARTSTR